MTTIALNEFNTGSASPSMTTSTAANILMTDYDSVTALSSCTSAAAPSKATSFASATMADVIATFKKVPAEDTRVKQYNAFSESMEGLAQFGREWKSKEILLC